MNNVSSTPEAQDTPPPLLSHHGRPKSELRVQLEALQPGQTVRISYPGASSLNKVLYRQGVLIGRRFTATKGPGTIPGEYGVSIGEPERRVSQARLAGNVRDAEPHAELTGPPSGSPIVIKLPAEAFLRHEGDDRLAVPAPVEAVEAPAPVERTVSNTPLQEVPEVTLCRADLDVLFEAKAKLPPDKTLRDCVEFYLACREKLAA